MTNIQLCGIENTAEVTWRNDLLYDLESIPKEGVPGRIIVWGPNAEPILTGIEEEDILIAAAESGKGRIVCVAHNAYCKNFRSDGGELKRFHDNVKKWLTRGTFEDSSDIINAKDDAQNKALISAKIIVSDGSSGKITSAQVEEFIRNGGGLFHCMTPWGWLQVNKGKSLSDAPYYDLLLHAGICYTNEHIQMKDNQFSVKLNKASEAHLLRLSKEAKQHPEKHKEQVLVSSRLKFLPEAALKDFRKNYPASSMIWQGEILQHIDSLPLKGQPGRIVVFGESAEPILTGSEEEDVLVAAAEFGGGRIVCVTQTAYGGKFQSVGGELQVFHDNVKKWLTRGHLDDGTSIINASDDVSQEQTKGTKIIMYCGGQAKLSPVLLKEFVRNGGGFFHCFTPWGWLQLNKGKSLSDAPYWDFLVDAGLCYTDEYIRTKDNRFLTSNNKAKDSHLMRVIKEVEMHPQNAEHCVEMLKSVQFLPANVKASLKPSMENLWKRCSEEIKLGNIPSSRRPIENNKDRALLDLWLVFVGILELSDVKAPGVNVFPGDFEDDPSLKCHEFDFSSDREEFFSTSCYLPAGKTMKLDIVSGNEKRDWQVMIGCHTDHLKKGKIRRWPTINRKVKITSNTHLISSAFGGLVYFISPDQANSKIKVKIDNITDSPHFKLIDGEEGRKVWQMSRGAPGLWADIEGDLIAFTLPSQSVRHLEFDKLFSTMKVWDSVVRLYHDLRGTDVSKFRRQWVVCDEQPSAGYMHSGYPIVTHLDVTDPKRADIFLLDGESLLKEGRWGIFHEIGHNMQRSMWTFGGTGEVTCNVFTLAAMDCICHLKPWIISWLRNQIKDTEKFLKDGAQFEIWKQKPGVALFIYAQLAHAFGWKSYKNVFRKYEAMSENEKPNADQEKIDSWFLTFSEVVGHNLAPLARFWGIGISVEMTKRLETAFSTAFLPDDEITKMSPTRVDKLLKQFPNLVRTVESLT